MTTHLTEWEVLDMAAVAEDFGKYEEEAQERRSRGAVVKAPEGKSTWRILPPMKGRKIWYYRAWTHSVNNGVLQEALKMLAALPDAIRASLAADLGVVDLTPVSLGDGFRSTYCESKMHDGDCLMCKLVSALYKISRSSDALKRAGDLASEMKSKEEYFAGAVRVDDPKEMAMGPRILQLPTGIFEKMNKILVRSTTDEELGGDFSHPEKGFNLIIDRVVSMGPDKKPIMVPLKNGKSIPKTEYHVTSGRSPSKIKDTEWLKHMHDLTKAREMPDDTAMRSTMEGSKPLAPAQGLPAGVEKKQIAAASAGAADEWLEDPEAPGDYDTRANLLAKGRRV